MVKVLFTEHETVFTISQKVRDKVVKDIQC